MIFNFLEGGILMMMKTFAKGGIWSIGRMCLPTTTYCKLLWLEAIPLLFGITRKSSLLLSSTNQQIAAYNDSIVANIIQEILQPLWHLVVAYTTAFRKWNVKTSLILWQSTNKGQVLINKLLCLLLLYTKDDALPAEFFSNCDFLGHNILFRTKHNSTAATNE